MILIDLSVLLLACTQTAVRAVKDTKSVFHSKQPICSLCPLLSYSVCNHCLCRLKNHNFICSLNTLCGPNWLLFKGLWIRNLKDALRPK